MKEICLGLLFNDGWQENGQGAESDVATKKHDLRMTLVIQVPNETKELRQFLFYGVWGCWPDSRPVSIPWFGTA